jgi:hypothetical protein
MKRFTVAVGISVPLTPRVGCRPYRPRHASRSRRPARPGGPALSLLPVALAAAITRL